MDKVIEKLKETKEQLGLDENNFLGIFLYGSQNYGLADVNSDLDSIVLVYSARKPAQEILSSFGMVKIYTLKHFFHKLRKGNLKCYEILYTKYRVLNPAYEKSFNDFVARFTMNIDYSKIKNSLYKKLNEHINHIMWLILKQEGAKYNKKRLYWAIRVCNQLKRIEEGEDFASSLVYIEDAGLNMMKIKSQTNFLSIKELDNIYKALNKINCNKPTYSIVTNLEEEECFTLLHSDIAKLYEDLAD